MENDTDNTPHIFLTIDITTYTVARYGELTKYIIPLQIASKELDVYQGNIYAAGDAIMRIIRQALDEKDIFNY